MNEKTQLELIKKVHGNNAITALLYSAASIFQKTITEEVHFFPILFNTGTFATGKSKISETMQFLTGSKIQSFDFNQYIKENKANILVLREKSPITIFDDYIKGDDRTDALLKAVWDRVGFVRGTSSGKKAIETIEINSALVLNGHQESESSVLNYRFIWNEFSKNNFTYEEIQLFNQLQFLKDSNQIIPFDIEPVIHQTFKKSFISEYIISENYLKEVLPKTSSRIFHNYLVLIVVFDILKNIIEFPFSEKEMIAHFSESIKNQNNYLGIN